MSWQITFYKNGNYFASNGETITASWTSTGTGNTPFDAQTAGWLVIKQLEFEFIQEWERSIYPATMVRQFVTRNYDCNYIGN